MRGPFTVVRLRALRLIRYGCGDELRGPELAAAKWLVQFGLASGDSPETYGPTLAGELANAAYEAGARATATDKLLVIGGGRG